MNNNKENRNLILKFKIAQQKTKSKEDHNIFAGVKSALTNQQNCVHPKRSRMNAFQ